MLQPRERHNQLLALQGKFNAIHLESEIIRQNAQRRGRYTRQDEEKLVTLGNAHKQLLDTLEELA